MKRNTAPEAPAIDVNWMSLKHANAVVIGGGAGGGVVAKELAEAGLSVVLLELGKSYTPFDDRNDDLRRGSNDRKCGHRARFPAPAYFDKGPPTITAGE